MAVYELKIFLKYSIKSHQLNRHEQTVRSDSRRERPGWGVHTFLPQQEGVEGHVVDAEVEEALAGHAALPAATRVECHQLLRRRQAEVPLELEQRLPELLRVLLLGGLATPHFLRDEALPERFIGLKNPVNKAETRLVFIFLPHLDFSLDKAGDILLVLKDRERVENVVDQPVPMFVHLLHGSS